jgi:hypothetical protein
MIQPEMKPIKAMEWGHYDPTTEKACDNKQCVLVEWTSKFGKYLSLICPKCMRELKYE